MEMEMEEVEMEMEMEMERKMKGAVKILLDEMEEVERGQKDSNTSQPYFFRVPRERRDLNPDSFAPHVVIIGPLVHDVYGIFRSSLELKRSYLHDLLHRLDSTSEQTLKACAQKLVTKESQIRASYPHLAHRFYDYYDILERMVMDGCFIIEFCYKHHEDGKKCLQNKIQNVRIAIDLILVENQIPFYVLQDLFDCTIKKISQIPFTSILHKVLALYLHPFTNPLPSIPGDSTYDHILDLFHRCYKLPQTESPSVVYYTEPLVRSVVELDRSGVNFKPHKDKDLPMAIRFKSSTRFVYHPFSWGKPTLLLPQLVINKCSEPVLRNLIAYEQSVPQVHHNFTSYAYTMDKLVDTEDDVSKLVESKVIVNKLGSNEEVASLINGIYKNSLVISDDYGYTQELSRLDDYCNRYWPKNFARLKRTYFSSPWNAIALIAGIILFSLTVVQTVYSIRQAK